MKLTYIGDHERDFPGVGTFEPGKVIEVNQETAEKLLASGYFVEQIEGKIEERPDNAELEPVIEKPKKGSVK